MQDAKKYLKTLQKEWICSKANTSTIWCSDRIRMPESEQIDRKFALQLLRYRKTSTIAQECTYSQDGLLTTAKLFNLIKYLHEMASLCIHKQNTSRSNTTNKS